MLNSKAIQQPEYINAIEDELKLIFSRNKNQMPDQLFEMLFYHMGWSNNHIGGKARGKRIRPLLVITSTNACGGDWKHALPVAAAVEIIHNFSLIHDDIEDQSHYRRGRKTLWSIEGPAIAINSGDTMFALAFTALDRINHPQFPGVALKAHQKLIQTCLELTYGQHLDISFESKSMITIEKYWDMVNGKTASLLASSCQLGAMMSGADNNIQDCFYKFGKHLGLAFQAQDDYLGIWGNFENTGKSSESDLLSKKKTLPIIYAYQNDNGFKDIWHQENSDSKDVTHLMERLDKTDAHGYTQSCVENLTGKAMEALAETGYPDDDLTSLIHIANSLINRNA